MGGDWHVSWFLITGAFETIREERPKKGGGMDPAERATGTRDEQYNLVSALYHPLHGAENCEAYAADAEATGDADLAAFFRNTQATQRRLAEQAKERLGIGGVATPGTAEVGTAIPPEGVTGPGALPTPRDVRRGTS